MKEISESVTDTVNVAAAAAVAVVSRKVEDLMLLIQLQHE